MDSPPKIYDITDIAFFPYSPGIREWLLLLALAMLAALAMFLWSRLRSKRSAAPPAFEATRRELSSVIALERDGLVPKESVRRAALIVRRFLGVAEIPDAPHLTAREIEREVAKRFDGATEPVGKPSEGGPPTDDLDLRARGEALRRIAGGLSSLEAELYRPKSVAGISAGPLKELIRAVESYHSLQDGPLQKPRKGTPRALGAGGADR